MQWDVSLNPPLRYSKLGFVLLFLALLVTLILFIIKRIKINKEKKLQEEKVIDINKIKKDYLDRIDSLMIKINNNVITKRKAYNELSLIIREFIFKATNIDVLKYTLAEAKRTKNEALIELLNEYYEPEFSFHGEGNLTASVDKTRKVIIEWK